MSADKQDKQKESKYQLPMKEIKKDLVKTLIFAVFCVAVLSTLHFTGVTFESIAKVLK